MYNVEIKRNADKPETVANWAELNTEIAHGTILEDVNGNLFIRGYDGIRDLVFLFDIWGGSIIFETYVALKSLAFPLTVVPSDVTISIRNKNWKES